MTAYTQQHTSSSAQYRTLALVVLLMAAIGGFFIATGSAATFSLTAEAESGIVAGNADKVAQTGSSGGSGVRFGQSAGVPDPNPVGNVVNVSTTAQLTAALAAAKAGDVITLKEGRYAGRFNSIRSGTAAAPITLTGSRAAIIDGGSLSSGYTLSLGTKNSGSTVSHWQFKGFTVTGGQKGVMWDNVRNSLIDKVAVQNVGHEGIHLRNFSSSNTIQNSLITKTGQDDQRYGEGLYIGTAQSNWDTFSQGKPDRSDGNRLIANNISYTGAESIDIKEGTHSGLIDGNTLDGIGMCYDATVDCNFADSLLDIKGEGWTVSNNTGKRVRVTWQASGVESDGFQVHVISQAVSEGSGNNNTFKANRLSDIAGYGFNIQSKATGTVLSCDNTVTNAGKGLANMACK